MHDSRTQIYEETNYFKKNYKFWTEPRSCMVLGLKPMVLGLWDMIPSISYAQLFIHVKITSSKTMRFATIVNITKDNKHVI